jgi:hypothetical protein
MVIPQQIIRVTTFRRGQDRSPYADDAGLGARRAVRLAWWVVALLRRRRVRSSPSAYGDPQAYGDSNYLAQQA